MTQLLINVEKRIRVGEKWYSIVAWFAAYPDAQEWADAQELEGEDAQVLGFPDEDGTFVYLEDNTE